MARVKTVGAVVLAVCAGLAWRSPAEAAQEPSLRIVVLEGQGRENVLEREVEVPTLVEVRDGDDLPVSAASVLFVLAEGGTATLNEGLRQVARPTNALGQAAVMVNPVAVGVVELAVTATFEGETATAAIVQTNFATEEDAAAGVLPTGVAETGAAAGDPAGGGGGAAQSRGGLGTGAILGLAGAGAAVGVGVAVAGGGDSSPPPLPPTRPEPSAGVPSASSPPTLRAGDGELAVSWGAPADNGAAIIDYDVRHRPSGGSGWTETLGRTATSVTITNLTNGTTYEVQVRARNSVGRGPWSQSARGTPMSPASAPSRPAAPTLTAGDGELRVSWTAPADNGAAIIDYDVRHRPSGGGRWTETLGRTATSVTIANLTNGTTYEVQVRARNSVGRGPWSPSARGAPMASASAPSRPSAPTLTAGDGELRVSWTAPADNGAAIIDYDVRHRPSGGGRWTETLGRTATSVTIADLTNGTTYEVQVRARNSVGHGPWSPIARGAPMSSASAPSRPAAPTLTPGDGELRVSWTAPADNGAAIIDYDLRHRPSGSSRWTETLGRTATSVTIANLTNGTTYEVQVRARNSVGHGPWSPIARGAPMSSASAPSRPAAPTLTPGDGELGVSWTAPADNGAPIEYYEVQARLAGSGTWEYLARDGDREFTVTSLTIVGLTNGTTYEVRVRAVNSVGASDWSPSARGTPAAAGAPDTPAAPTLTPGDGELGVSWRAPSGPAVDYYELRVRALGEEWQYPSLPGDEKITATRLRLAGLTNGTTYEVQIRALNSAGASGWSESGRGTPAASAGERALVRLSVGDASAEETADDTLDFTVTLDRAASTTVSVDYATSDGSAQAGADYTATSGTLTFLPGERSKTVRVAILDDTHDEGEETLTLTLSNASGAVVADGQATGRIENHDPLPRALLARFGRTAAVHVVEQVEERLQAPREPGVEGRFAGQDLRPGMRRDLALGVLGRSAGRVDGASGLGAPGPLAPGVGQLAMGGPGGGGIGDGGLFGAGGGDLLAGSAFAFNHETRQGGVLSFWSRGAQSSFMGREGALALDGDVRTTMFGADYAKGPVVVGLSLANSRGLGNYAGVDAGRVATSVTGLYPWLGYRVTDRVTVWGVTGYGAGGMMLTPGGGPTLESGLSMAMAAGGTRSELIGGGPGGFGLAFKADALWVGTSVEGVDGPSGRLAATGTAVTRFRTGLEGSREFLLAGRLSLKPSAEVGLRHDGGDAETGAGLDVGGGLILADSSTGLAVDVRVRTLLAHQAQGFRERGMAVTFSYDPTPSTPLGFMARVAPSWGGHATGGTEALWGRETMGGLADGGFATGNRLGAEVGYGLPVASRFVGTPRVGFAATEYGKDYRVGYGLTLLQRGTLDFELGVDARRRENVMLDGADNGLLGRATVGW